MDRAAYGDVSLIRRSRRQLLRIRSEERGRHPKETHSTHSRRTTLYLPCTGRLFEGGGCIHFSSWLPDNSNQERQRYQEGSAYIFISVLVGAEGLHPRKYGKAVA